jgi:hypothetical protein
MGIPPMDELKINLRINTEDIEPDEITSLLGIKSSRSFCKGDTIGSHGSARSASRTHNHWSIQETTENVERLSEIIVSMLKAIPDAALATLQDRGAEIDLFVGGFGVRDQSTFWIGVEAMEAFSQRSISIVVDLYTADL